MQLTYAQKNHFLVPFGPFSPDDQWLAYDTRTEEASQGKNGRVEKVNLKTGECVLLYETANQSEYGPGCGTPSYSPVANRVVFIHGPTHADANHPYQLWRRTGVAVDDAAPGKAIFLDARDITAPFTPGALRGGTHAHQWSADGKWISFTYNDALLAAIQQKTGEPVDLRTVGVATALKSVAVDRDAEGENNDGQWFSVVLVKVVPHPKPGSDEISRACEEGWIGTQGYRRADGTWQRALVFQGTVCDKNDRNVAELFIVDIPEKIDVPGDDGPLEGTATSMPMPPKGTVQRRLTRTTDRKYPGVVGEPRHWIRTSPDGSRISYLAKDDRGIVQVFFVDPLKGEPRQVTQHDHSIQSMVTWNADGTALCYVCDNSIYLCDVREGSTFGQTKRLTERTAAPPLCPTWSHDGKKIAFNRDIADGPQSFRQILLLNL